MAEFANIPTVYNGVRFRSRLEAKWACMFDLLGWSWEYEPVDLNGWIPDFVITNARRRLYVEVKPDTEFPDKEAIKIERAIGHDREKMELDSCRNDPEIFITSSTIMPNDDQPWYSIGWVFDPYFGQDAPWSKAVFMLPCSKTNNLFGLTSDVGGYGDRIGGCRGPCCEWDGDHNYRPAYREDFEHLWKAATNKTQWKRPA